MSSLRNASKAHQRTHRPRSTPSGARGRLEHHDDYRRRADDRADKQKTLKLLRKRALDRNPDEFYHHMINSKISKGEHHEVEKEDESTTDQIKLMQTQDIKYVNMKRTIERNRIGRMQSELHLIDSVNSVPNNHTFFVDDVKEMKEFNIIMRLDTHPSLIKNRTNRLRIADLENMDLPEVSEEVVEKLKGTRNKAYKELSKRIDREQQLSIIQQKMELKRHLQDKKVQKPQRVKAGTKSSAPIYKWKYERKK